MLLFLIGRERGALAHGRNGREGRGSRFAELALAQASRRLFDQKSFAISPRDRTGCAREGTVQHVIEIRWTVAKIDDDEYRDRFA